MRRSFHRTGARTRRTVFICAAGVLLLLLAGAAVWAIFRPSSETPVPAADEGASFSCTLSLHTEDFDGQGVLERADGRYCLTLSQPQELAGLEAVYENGALTYSFHGLEFSYAAEELNPAAFMSLTAQVLEACADGEGLTFADGQYSGQAGGASFTATAEGGLVTTFSVPEYGLEAKLTEASRK